MPEPITPHNAEQEIMRLSRLLDHATGEIARRGRVRARAKIERDHALALAYVGAEGPVEERKALRDIECSHQIMRFEVADASYRNARDAAHNIRAQLDALRSVNANVRHQTR